MNSSPLAGCQFHVGLIRSFQTMFLKIKSGQSVHYMAVNFIQASSVHSYGTRFRESGNCSIPKVKSFGKKSFIYNGCILWNDLPSHIKEKQSISDFNITVKKHFLEILPE